jgi:hypothetical protein
MSKGFLAIVVFVLISACSTQRKICPAYQSAFIFDQEALRKKFSYFENDSTPKVYTASRNNYLVIPEQSYRKKLKSLQTIEMKPVYTVLPDTSAEKKGKGEGDFYKAPENIDSLLRTQTRDLEAPPETPKAMDSAVVAKKDSVEVDSSYQITKDKEVRFYRYHWDTLRRRTENLRGKKGEELSSLYKKYQKSNDSAKYRVDNIRYRSEQELYMWYLRDVLVLPDVRAAMEEEKRAKDTTRRIKDEPDTVKKVGFFKGLKGLFKKKPKSDSTNVAESVPTEEEEESLDENTDPVVVDSVVTKKKKRKKKSKSTEPKKENPKPIKEKKKDPVKKEEDEDDGF